MTRKAGHYSNQLYSHDIILVLFKSINQQDYKNKYLATGDWSQSRLERTTA